jgi:rhodanese-related sulfurtransferase
VSAPTPPGPAGGADRLLAGARGRIGRLTPAEAWSAAAAGTALILDIRSSEARAAQGVVPGSTHVPRTVLEWRLDPGSPWCNPHLAGSSRRLVVLCDHGLSSSLAAAALVDLGYPDAADVEGGVAAWRAAGLPLRAAPSAADRELLPGMGPPDG